MGCLVRRQAVRPLARPARPDPRDANVLQHELELRAVRPLSRCDDKGQRAAAAVRAQVELGGEPPASGPGPHLLHHLHQAGDDALPRRFARVFCCCSPLRREPAVAQCGRQRRAGVPARRWSRPRCPSRSPRPRRPRPGPAGAGVPRFRRPTTGGGLHRPSSTGRIVRAGHATERPSAPGAESRRSPAGDPATCRNACC
jgi:hypothetical protein